MDPHHDRFLLRPFVVGLPDIQVQAVFTLRIETSHLTGAAHLAGNFSEIICLIYTVVRCDVHRCFPAVFPDGLLSHEGNALIRNNALRLLSDKSAVDTLDRQRMVIIIVSNLFVLAV